MERDTLISKLTLLKHWHQSEANKASDRRPRNTHPSHWSYQEAIEAEDRHTNAVYLLEQTIAYLKQ